MPIRFVCPDCRQKLSISTRRAGTEAKCPRCKRALTVPEAPAESPRPKQAEAAAAGAASAAFEVIAPHGEISYDLKDELVLEYEVAEEIAPAAPGGDLESDVIAVPRFILYLQGGLLAAVALVSFAIGLLAGGAYSGSRPAPAEQRACLIEGTINYATDDRNLPDQGAVIAVIPQGMLQPDEKAPVAGLRPADTIPNENHRGLAILRELGGAYARSDDEGHFQVRVPNRGRFLVLVISQARELQSLDEISTADLLKLGAIFDDAAELVGRQRYQLTMENVRGDRRMNVLFQ
jgi:hypothetical protein